MLMPASSEFVALCKAQVMLLTHALEASICVVYLTQELGEGRQPQLVPIVTYPESLTDQDRQRTLVLPPALQPVAHSPEATSELGALVEQPQLVLPLVFEGHVFGILVTRRDDRAWSERERFQIEEVARTLAFACVMDQRHQWSQQEREQERLLHLQQRDLLDNLLHQLRNSLTALQTFGKLVLRRLIPGDRNYELATNITRETVRLRELAEQMQVALDLDPEPRLQSLAASPVDGSNPEPAQLGEATLEALSSRQAIAGLLPGANLPLDRCLVETVLEPLLTAANAIAQEHDLTLQTVFQDDLPPIWANAIALREALNNLIENAIKYTPAGGSISVEVTAPEVSSLLNIAISDTGLGIPQEDLPHIFERQYRGVQAQGTIPGTGLGLAIARSLIDQMHGTIQVFSPALSAELLPEQTVTFSPCPGTTFLVQLPIAIETES